MRVHWAPCHGRRHRRAQVEGTDVGRRGVSRREHVTRGPPVVNPGGDRPRVGHVEGNARRAGARRRPLQQVGLLRALLGREGQLLLGLGSKLADTRGGPRYGTVMRQHVPEEHPGGLGVGRLGRVSALDREEGVGLPELVAVELTDSIVGQEHVGASLPHGP